MEPEEGTKSTLQESKFPRLCWCCSHMFGRSKTFSTFTPQKQAASSSSSAAHVKSTPDISAVQRDEQSCKAQKPKEGEIIWIQHVEEGFVKAEVLEVLDTEVIVKTPTNDGRDWKRIELNRCFPTNPDNLDGEPDNTALMHLHDPALLHNIRYRYENNNIYTYTAGILIVVNPFKNYPANYSRETMLRYKGKALGILPPHIFAVADKAYRSMKALKQNQSIIVSGESGAGKTETCKHVIRYLTAISSASVEGFSEEEHEEAEFDEQSLERKILETNQILESFGNALTVRNNNSSRFGKYTELNFNAGNHICGASIETYLLEKSRVAFQAEGERNYHAFYQLVAGAPANLAEEFHINQRQSDSSEFHYLSHPHDHGIDDKTGFQLTERALEIIGLDANDRKMIWQTLAAILHMGNIEFGEDRQDRAFVKNSDVLHLAADLFCVDRAAFEKKLTTRTLRTGRAGEKPIISPLNAAKAAFSRDALAKDVYSRVFGFLVSKLNSVLVADVSVVCHHIGILDIFGFEVMEHNSLEQLLINYTNELLQVYFSKNVITQEMELYEREGISFSPIEYSDNSPAVSLIGKERTGMLAMLDDECQMPKGTEQNYTERLHRDYARHSSLQFARTSKTVKGARRLRDDESFLFRHFAGEVVYETHDWLQKNNDSLLQDLEDLMLTTSLPFLQTLFPQPQPQSGQSKRPKKFKSIATTFSQQLNSLLKNLESTTSHFVRCIKPNSQQVPVTFQGAKVMEQLRCSGMFEVLLLMHKGYPTRCPIDDLHKRYKDILPEPIKSLPPSEFCVALLVALFDVERDDFQLGITKVFLRAGQLAKLEELNSSEYQSVAEDVVEKVRRWLTRKKLKRAQWAILSYGRWKRTLECLRARDRVSRFSIMVFLISQTWLKLARRVKRKFAASKIQATFKMTRVRSDFLVLRANATKIQAVVRGHLVYTAFAEDLRLLKEERLAKKKALEEEEKRRREEEIRRREEAKRKKEQDEKDELTRKIEEDRRRAKERVRRMEERWQATREKPKEKEKEKEKVDVVVENEVVERSHNQAAEVVEVVEEAKAKTAPPEFESESESISVTMSESQVTELVQSLLEKNMDRERTRREEESVKSAKIELRLREIEHEMKELRKLLESEIEEKKDLKKEVGELKMKLKLSEAQRGGFAVGAGVGQGGASASADADAKMFAKMERLGLRVQLKDGGRERSSSMQVDRLDGRGVGVGDGAKARLKHRPTKSVAVFGRVRNRSASTQLNEIGEEYGYERVAPAPIQVQVPAAQAAGTMAGNGNENENEDQKRGGGKGRSGNVNENIPSAVSLLGRLARGTDRRVADRVNKAPAPAMVNREALQNLQAAVDKLKEHFAAAAGLDKAAGDDEKNRKIVGLVRGGLCTAIAKVFSWGFNSFKIFGRYHVLDVFEGLNLDESPAGSPEYSLRRAIAVVNSVHKGYGNKDMRYRSIVCKGLNERILHDWVLLFDPKTQPIIAKLFQPYSFFHIDELRNEISSIMYDLKDMPFSLSLDFEIRRWDI